MWAKMTDNQIWKIFTRFKTYLILGVVLNVAFIVIYTYLPFKMHSADINNSSSMDLHVTVKKYNSNGSVLKTRTKTKSHRKNHVESDCKELLLPEQLSPEVAWRHVDRNRSAFVYSAYNDKENRKLVIVGAKVKDFSTYYCQLWYRLDEHRSFKMKERPARVSVLLEGHGKKYTATLFECLLTSSSVPDFVSVVIENCETPLHLLRVVPNIDRGTNKSRFTVCLNPLNFHYDRENELVEWIELNRILGAEKFIVYNHSSSINIKRILDFYSKRGLTEVVQWQLPMGVDTYPNDGSPVEIHYFGQIAALNDCLYRSKPHSEFIVNIDLDEFIVPHSDSAQTWSDMLKQLYKVKKKAFGAYLFRHTFFPKEWSNTNISVYNKTLIEKYKLITLQKLEHENKVFPSRIRSKYFARTLHVSRVMIHEIRSLPYSQLLTVPPSFGLLHHYRNCEDLNVPATVRVVDKTVMNKYGKTLLINIQNIWLEIEKHV